MNDIVYVDDDDVHVGCKRVREVFRDAADKKHVKPVRNEVIGILSTGHMYEVYDFVQSAGVFRFCSVFS
jgi:hypothetical protein